MNLDHDGESDTIFMVRRRFPHSSIPCRTNLGKHGTAPHDGYQLLQPFDWVNLYRAFASVNVASLRVVGILYKSLGHVRLQDITLTLKPAVQCQQRKLHLRY